MGELKSCLFCGKNVDSSFQYCPHCGYEFGQGEDNSTGYRGDRFAEYRGDVSGGYRGDKSAEYRGELPAPVDERAADATTDCGGEDYLLRIRTLQELLADMEKELDLIIRTSSKDP
jgi:hypothetical protein